MADLSSLWPLGTLASIAYSRMRNPLAHYGGAPHAISFDLTTYRGQPAPEIRFELLLAGLQGTIDALQEISLHSDSWFGHDFAEN